MSNLLPPTQANVMSRSMTARLILVLGLVLIAAAFAGALSLIPSYVLITEQNKSYEDQAKAVTPPASAGADLTDQKELAKTRAELSALAEIKPEGPNIVEAIQEALSKRPAGISISTILYSNETGDSSVILSGKAPSREAITGFRDALKTDMLFSGVTVPLNELAVGATGSFHITLTGNF